MQAASLCVVCFRRLCVGWALCGTLVQGLASLPCPGVSCPGVCMCLNIKHCVFLSAWGKEGWPIRARLSCRRLCCKRHTPQLQHSSGPPIKLGPTRTLLYCSHLLRLARLPFSCGCKDIVACTCTLCMSDVRQRISCCVAALSHESLVWLCDVSHSLLVHCSDHLQLLRLADWIQTPHAVQHRGRVSCCVSSLCLLGCVTCVAPLCLC